MSERQGAEVPANQVIVLFGASGDLAKRKTACCSPAPEAIERLWDV